MEGAVMSPMILERFQCSFYHSNGPPNKMAFPRILCSKIRPANCYRSGVASPGLQQSRPATDPPEEPAGALPPPPPPPPPPPGGESSPAAVHTEKNEDVHPKSTAIDRSQRVEPNDKQKSATPSGTRITYRRELLVGLRFSPLSLLKPKCVLPEEIKKDSHLSRAFQPPLLPTPMVYQPLTIFPPNGHCVRLPSVDSGLQEVSWRIVDKPPDPNVPAVAWDHSAYGFRTLGRPGCPSAPWIEPPPVKKTIPISLNKEVKLRTCSNAWKPRRLGSADGEDSAKTQELYKKVRGLLNKITAENFPRIGAQIKLLDIDTEEKLRGVADIIFGKAIEDHVYTECYAKMCRELAQFEVPATGQSDQFVNFRKLLLTNCQRHFETCLSDRILQEEQKSDCRMSEEEEENLFKTKRRCLGNVKFIGELFKSHMIIEQIVNTCAGSLFQRSDEFSLEQVCLLLRTVGKELKNKEMMPHYRDHMENLIKGKTLKPRIQFMLEDIVGDDMFKQAADESSELVR